MTWRSFAAGLLAGAGLLACAASANAQDTVKLKLTPTNDAPTLNLVGGADDAAIIDVRGRGFVGGRGFGGGRGFYGRGFYGRGFGWGWGWGGYYGGYYGYPYYYSAPAYYYSPYYYSPYYYSPYYYPIGNTTVSTPYVTVRIGSSSNAEPLPAPTLPADPSRTYPYDGGPAYPVPMPPPVPNTTNDLQAPPKPVQDRAVSLPANSGGSKFAYPAYGEKPAKTDFAADRVEKITAPIVVKKTTPK